MTNTVTFILLFSLTFSILMAFSPSTKQKLTDAQQEVWNYEVEYWKDFKAGNIEKLDDYWHEKFVSWSVNAATPGTLSESRASLAAFLHNAKIISYTLSPGEIAVHENIGVIHYFVDAEIQDPTGKKINVTYRTSHVWIKEGKKWKLISGMSAYDKEPSPSSK